MSPAQRPATWIWLRNDRGTAAIEFALIAVPFFLFVFAIVGIGLYFFTSHALERGVENAARKIRTGQAQKSDLTVAQFKELVCSEAGTYINCNNLHVIIQHASTWSGITPQSCVDDDDKMADSTGSTDDLLSDYSGESSSVALVTLCYQWDLANMFSFLNLGQNSDGTGAAIIQAATAFRIEPYSTS